MNIVFKLLLTFLYSKHFTKRNPSFLLKLPHLKSICYVLGRDGGLVVSMLAFYSNDTSSTPVEVYSFDFSNLLEKERKYVNAKRGRKRTI